MEEASTTSVTRPLTSIYDPVIVWDLYELLTLTWQISCHTSTLALFMWGKHLCHTRIIYESFWVASPLPPNPQQE